MIKKLILFILSIRSDLLPASVGVSSYVSILTNIDTFLKLIITIATLWFFIKKSRYEERQAEEKRKLEMELLRIQAEEKRKQDLAKKEVD